MGDFAIQDGTLIRYTGTERHVLVPEGVVAFGKWAFRNCAEMQTIQLPASLRALGVLCFEGCSSLMEIQIPEGVQTIPYGAFWSCYALKYVGLPDSLRRIEDRAFVLCHTLKAVPMPPGLESWPYNLYGVDYGCHVVTQPDGSKWLCKEPEETFSYWDMHPYPLDPKLRRRMGYGALESEREE